MHQSSIFSMKKYFLLLINFCVLSAQGNDRIVKGIVNDGKGNVLPYATVRIDHSGYGTICDGSGNYELVVTNDTCSITYSYIGYRSRTVRIGLGEKQYLDISLQQSEIELTEVIVGSEDPAFDIIREAIENKKKRRKMMENYDAKVYIKESFGSDTLLSVISEAYCKVRYQLPDSLQEEVLWRRQSSNLPEEIQFALVRDYLDFYDDTIKYMGYSFIGPLSENAFQFYDYRLIRSSTVSHQVFYDIEIIPLSNVQPLFRGTITLTDSGFYLQTINVSVNSMFQIPLITIDSVVISQQYAIYEKKFWMPLEYHVYAKVRYRIFSLVHSRPLNYRKSVISYEYNFTPTNDSSSTALKKTMPALANKDNVLENGGYPVVFPLTTLEISSYKKIDDLVKQHPAAFGVPKYIKMVERWTENIDIRYNRAEGLFIGGMMAKEAAFGFYPFVRLGYGFADRMIKYIIRPTFRWDAATSIAIGCEYHRWIGTFPVNYRINSLTNSAAALFDGEDYFNYYLSHGYRIFFSITFPGDVVLETSVQNEVHSSAFKNTDVSFNSIFQLSRFRENPSIREGRYFSTVIELFRRQESDTTGFTEPKNTWRIRCERSMDMKKQYFTSLYADAEVRIPTMGASRLFNPYLGIMLTAGYATGNLPPQKIFGIEAPLSGYAYPPSFRTLKPGDFTGNRLLAIGIEHNFRSIPFVLLGLSSIPLDIITRVAYCDISTAGSVSNSGNNGSSLRKYMEYTLGLGRVADLFRIDISYASIPQPRYVLTCTSFL